MLLTNRFFFRPQQSGQRVDFSWNKQSDPSFEFDDQALLDAVRPPPGVKPDADVEEMFRVFALCHTVMSTEVEGEQGFSL